MHRVILLFASMLANSHTCPSIKRSSLLWYPDVVTLIKSMKPSKIMVEETSAMQYAAIDKHPMTM